MTRSKSNPSRAAKSGLTKTAVRDALAAAVRHELEVLRAAAEDAAAGATHEENKPEHDKDMRATEASYLARGQAGRVVELTEAVSLLESLALRDFGEDDGIGLSALVHVEIDGETKSWLFVAPAGGGMRVEVAGTTVQTVTPRSPVGGALLKKSVGDIAEIQTRHGVREYEILAVR